jgi:hypothetical protein
MALLRYVHYIKSACAATLATHYHVYRLKVIVLTIHCGEFIISVDSHAPFLFCHREVFRVSSHRVLSQRNFEE